MSPFIKTTIQQHRLLRPYYKTVRIFGLIFHLWTIKNPIELAKELSDKEDIEIEIIKWLRDFERKEVYNSKRGKNPTYCNYRIISEIGFKYTNLKNAVKITTHSPATFIGSKGSNLKALNLELKKYFGKRWHIDLNETNFIKKHQESK